MASENLENSSSFEFRYSEEGVASAHQEEFVRFAKKLYDTQLRSCCDVVHVHPQNNLLVTRLFRNKHKEVRRTLYIKEDQTDDFFLYREAVFSLSDDRLPVTVLFDMNSDYCSGIWLNDGGYFVNTFVGDQYISLAFSSLGEFEGVLQSTPWRRKNPESWSWKLDDENLSHINKKTRNNIAAEKDDANIVLRRQVGNLVMEGVRVPRNSLAVTNVLESIFGNCTLVTNPLEESAQTDWDTWIDWELESALGIERVQPEELGQWLPRAEDGL